MPVNRFHCALSKKRTGQDYKELHKWIDDGCGIRGKDHRNSKRHTYNEETLRDIKKLFGDEAVGEWLFHIAIDYLDTMMYNKWNYQGGDINYVEFGFKNNGFIAYNEEQLSQEEIQDISEDSEEDEDTDDFDD